jgi:beta-lactamase regulating signal transducer with metallopeptidase domain/protein involved in polysaccharide export with SLBB domain
MTSAEICLTLIRTTLATAAAACLAALLLAGLKVRSPRVHRVTWALVVVQGWLLVPWTLKLETLPVAEVAPTGGMPSSAWAWSETTSARPLPRTAEAIAPKPVWRLADLAPSAILGWVLGGVGIALLAAWRYARIIGTLPLGAAPVDPAWRAEWRRELASARRGAMPSSAWACSVELRMTDRLGPLVAFVPFMYLVLAPRQLWAALTSRERRSILRHELAHLRRRDLWKSLAIRVLALPQWFNPLVWLAVRRFDEAAEWACDELAAHNHDPLTLANSLLRTAELCAAATQPPRAAGFIPAVPRGRSKLSRRIHRLVTPRFKEESTMRKLTVPALLAAIAAVQLVRIERVAAGDPPPSEGAASGGTADAAIADEPVFAEAATSHEAAKARRAEFEEIAERPYVIEPPDVLELQFNGGSIDPSATIIVDGVPKKAGELQEFELAPGFLPKPKQYLVAMDGEINLGNFGTVFVAGMTVDEAREAIEDHLGDQYENPEADVTVRQSNSKVCYIVDQRGKLGNVVRMPVPFPLTVDFNVGAALAQTEPREFDLADARIWVARPAAEGEGSELALPVAWDATTGGPTPDTNHPLLPGDRVFVEAPKSAGPRTIAPRDELAVTFKRADGARLDLADPEELRDKPRVIISLSSDSLTFQVPVEDDGRVTFRILWTSETVEVAGKTLEEAAQAIHDDIFGPQDRDFTVAVAPAGPPAKPPTLPASAAPAYQALPDPLPPELPATAELAYPPLSHDPPPRPTTTAKDPGPDAVVTLVLRLAKGREVEKPIAIAGPTTLGDLLASTTYPEPIDFAAATITLTRPFGPPELGGATEVFVGWDQAAQRPSADSNYGLEAGDTVTINLVGPPKGAKVHPEPVFSFSLGFSRNDGLQCAPPIAASAITQNPAPDADAAREELDPSVPLEFQIQFVEDLEGALADFDGLRDMPMTVGDAKTTLAALRVFKNHKLIKTLADPTIRTVIGRPASISLGEPADAPGDGGADFHMTQAVTVLARVQPYQVSDRYLLVEIRARAAGNEIDTGVAMHEGQTTIVRIPPKRRKDAKAVYVVVTPRWVE